MEAWPRKAGDNLHFTYTCAAVAHGCLNAAQISFHPGDVHHSCDWVWMFGMYSQAPAPYGASSWRWKRRIIARFFALRPLFNILNMTNPVTSNRSGMQSRNCTAVHMALLRKGLKVSDPFAVFAAVTTVQHPLLCNMHLARLFSLRAVPKICITFSMIYANLSICIFQAV